MFKFLCPKCGKEFMTEDRPVKVRCPYCGEEYAAAYGGNSQGQGGASLGLFDAGPSGKSRGVAGLLAILLGSLGVHYFYLNKTTGGVVFLIASLLTCGSVTGILSLITGIIMLVSSQEEFESKYVYTTNSMPLF